MEEDFLQNSTILNIDGGNGGSDLKLEFFYAFLEGANIGKLPLHGGGGI